MGIYERIFQKDVPVSWILICSKGHEARCLSLDNGLAPRVIAKILEVLTSLGMVQGRVCSDTAGFAWSPSRSLGHIARSTRKTTTRSQMREKH